MSNNIAEIEIQGIDRLLKKVERDVLSGPWKKAMQESLNDIQEEVRGHTPVDTGNLKGSITTKLDQNPMPLWGSVQTLVPYAKPLEYGTGRLSDGPGSSRQPFRPPASALQGWATRHGFANGYQVAAIIFKNGGTRPRRMFRDSIPAAIEAVRNRFDQAMREIEARWSQ